MKTEVYSWRVSRETKMALEQAARRANTPLAGLLDQIAQEWLRKQGADPTSAEERARAAAMKTFGSVRGGRSDLAENVSAEVKTRLRRRYGR